MTFKQYIAEKEYQKYPYAIWISLYGDEYVYLHATILNDDNYTLTYYKSKRSGGIHTPDRRYIRDGNWHKTADFGSSTYEALVVSLKKSLNPEIKEFATQEEFEQEWVLENI